MPAGVPPMVADAFTSIIPVSVIVILSAFVGRNIPNIHFLTLINDASSHLVVGGSHPIAQFIAFVLDRIFWFVGLHGSNIVGSIMTPILLILWLVKILHICFLHYGLIVMFV